ncbi:Glu/Leu/Phe/Val dehydrogenase dimerization domain-containing protein [Novosphingobium sp. PS1R-30]|uniref:Glu/Leu/Phe/Val dehydrogenase dimerization domain-containing protein n=1 Tax=Novosphingobium anseongense TaxID=3133436 RepID=A0ABU8S3T6_9SPHN
MMVRTATQDCLESLHVLDDGETGLKGVIAIHSTALGPAAGGCRFWRYAEREELVADAVRLARGMSYKNALAGLPFGGGKAVLLRPEEPFDRVAYFAAFGRAVAELEGRYVTAEDVGTTVADMGVVSDQTRFVAGLDAVGGRAGGDPSPWTALGVFESMKAAGAMLGIPLGDASVAVQGTGNVGAALCRLLAREGAKLIVADIEEKRAALVAREIGAVQVGVDEILEVKSDILAPCALGAVLNQRSIPRLKAGLVCGAANNQLAEEHHGDLLRDRGIVYAPDYLVNAGGIINVCAEYRGERADGVEARVMAIAPRLISVLERARHDGLASNRVADDLARAHIANVYRQGV